MPRFRAGDGQAALSRGARTVSFGAVTVAQVLPSQTSVSGETAPLALALLPPTATQCAAEGQDTDTSVLNVAGLGVVTIVQVVPFHCSAKLVSGCRPGPSSRQRPCSSWPRCRTPS